MKKIMLFALSVILIFGGYLGYSYYGFRMKISEKISAQDWKSAENILESWKKTKTYWVLKNIPQIKQKLTFEKAWLLAQHRAYKEAIEEFRKAANISGPLASQALYNATTIALSENRESLERLAEDYIKVLGKNPDDFQTKVNLEIIRILQKQSKMGIPAPGADGEGKEKQKIKKYRPGDEESQGTSSPESQGIRY